MLEQILYNEMTYWLLGTAVIFTFVGRFTAYRDHLQDIVASTIDSLAIHFTVCVESNYVYGESACHAAN